MKVATTNAISWLTVALLSVGHGAGDFNAGVLLAQLGTQSGSDLVTLYLLYNALAFAGQPFAGMICDRVGKTMSWFYFGGLLSGLSLTLASASPVFAVIVSGLASAFYHSAGGSAAWQFGGQRALAAGCFAAPGVAGLALGLAFGGALSFPGMLGGALAMMIVLLSLAITTPRIEAVSDPECSRANQRAGLIGSAAGWLVVVAIAARSFAWSLGQDAIFPPEYAVGLAFAAATGKCLAGLLADRFGLSRITLFSLAAAAFLLALGGRTPVVFFLAVTALQAATAPMMAFIFRAWPRRPALGSGLAQGMAVAIGGAPLFVLNRIEPFAVTAAVGAVSSAAVIMLFVNRTTLGATSRA